MEILNFQAQNDGTSCAGTFSVHLPNMKITLHKLRLIKTKSGNMIIGIPSYGVDQGDGKKKWMPYIEFGSDKSKEFNEKVLEALKPFIK